MLLGVASAQSLRQDTQLLDKPDGVGISTPVKSSSVVRMLKRQGFWVEIDAGGKTGWVKASMINFSNAGSAPVAIDTGRLGTGNIVSTSSARGMSAADLLSGKPNFEEVEKLDKLVADSSDVQAFMAQGNIKPSLEQVALSPVKMPPAASIKPSTTSGASGNSANNPSKQKGNDDW